MSVRQQKLEALLAEDPSDPFLHYALAMELEKSGDVVAAARRLQSVNEQFPDYIAAWFHGGRMCAELGDYAAARDTLKTGIARGRAVGDDHAVSEMSELLASLPESH